MSVCDGCEFLGSYFFPLEEGAVIKVCALKRWNSIKDEPPDSCPFPPILRALPDASEEQIERATEILVDRSCRYCEYRIPPYSYPMLLSIDWCNSYSKPCHNVKDCLIRNGTGRA